LYSVVATLSWSTLQICRTLKSLYVFLYFAEQKIKPRASCMLCKHSTFELYPLDLKSL
jgi:hypothetical protein